MSSRSLEHLRYLRVYATHKWWVLVAGLRVGVPLRRLIVHDLTKLSRHEYPAYVTRFAAGRGGKFTDSEDTPEWIAAYAHHVAHNPHHWEHWQHDAGGGLTVYLPIPETYAREMVADWMGAGKAYTGDWDHREWYERSRGRIGLHAETRRLVERLLREH